MDTNARLDTSTLDFDDDSLDPGSLPWLGDWEPEAPANEAADAGEAA